MMESCLNHKPEKVGSTALDIKKDLSSDFSKLSKQDSVLLEKEHLQVYLRVRPFTTSERAEGASQECISIEPPETVILRAHRASLTARHSERFGPQQAQRFQFSQVYGPDTTQREIFDGTTKSLVKEVLDGGNSLIFTYGVTNAGKTFTFLGPDSDCGILPRSLNVIFKSIEGRIYSQNSIKPHRCVDFMKLTEEQQDDEATYKRNLLRRFKDIDPRKTLSSMSSSSCSLFESSTFSDTNRDSVCLDDTSRVKFSVWVSFCEIYNENIHDLLDIAPNVSHRRTVLRLAQDVKGNAFVKDQKSVQVNSAEEALKVVKIGMKNQSSSSTKLNNVSSRSHSIFSIRILRIEDVGVPHVQTISELSLCDLAGSERCAKTQNQGDRLKEAGNINTSLLTLGKCINALRLNQTQPKIHQHIPFRESKLTHYLQGFFCGRGKACMIININQCASVYDETLNVLKFSALAQKVVVLNPKPAPSIAVKRSDRNVSMIINNADKKDWARRSSLMGWEMNREDMQEDKDDEEMGEEDDEESDDKSMEDNIVLETVESRELFELQVKIEAFKEKLSKEESEKLTMESRIHEEVGKFMELFSNMEKDYNDRLQRAKEIVEERRLEILKNLVNRTIGEMAAVSTDENAAKEAKIEHLDSMIEAMRDDLAKIKGDAEAVQICLTNVPESPRTISDLRTQLEEMREELLKSQQLLSLKTIEFEAMCVQMQESDYQLLQANRNYENKKLRCQELMSVCQEKNGMISTLQTALDQNVEAATKDQALINNIKEEIQNFRNNCKCMLNEDGEPRGEEMTSQETQQLLQELKMKDEQLNELKLERCSLEKKVCDLSDRLAERTHAHEATVEMERAEVNKVTNENKALANDLHVLQQAASEMSSKLKTLQMELSTQTKIANELSEELDAAKTLIKGHQAEYSSQSKSIESLMTEADHLRQELSARQLSHDKTQAECERMVELSHEKSRQINDLEQEVSQTRANMCQLEELCSQLQYERDAQAKEYQSLLSCYEAQKVVVAQIKSNSELLEELNVLNHQQGRIEEQDQDSRDDCWKKLQDKLIQTLSKLNQHEEVQNIVRTIVENEISEVRDKAKRRITAMEKDLAHKDEELETKAQELSNHLRQELSAHQLSHDKTQAECERMVELSHEKSRQINDLEQEVSQTRANMCQLEELCSQLQYERDAQAKEYQSLLSCYEAQKVVVAQIKSNSELLEELNVLNHQQGRIEEQDQDSRDDCWKKLQDKLIQTLSKLNQHEEVQNIVRTIVENEISEVRDKAKRRITAMEKDLAHKDEELETKAQELSNHLRQELSARQLSHDKTQAECERMVELSHEKSRQINDLEQEVSQTRANMCQLEELCSQLQYERDAQAKEYQSLLSCYEAQKVVVAQIKSNSELLEELNVLNHQQGRIEEQDQDSRDDCWKKLQDKLIQTLSKLNQHEEVQNIVRTIVENEISEVRDKAKRRITAMEKDLAHKDEELETKAQELSNHLRQELSARQLSHDKTQAECERMVELSHEKSRQINDLEQEVSQTRANMCQLEELCSQLQYECDAQAKEYQSLLSCYEAQKVVVAQIKSNSELLEELNVLNHQQGRIEEQDQDSRDDCWKKLQDKLIQTLSKLNQHEEVQNIVRTIVENEISEVRDKAKRRITAMEKDLAHKDEELETKAQELSNHLRQELSARQLSHDKTQAECERMVELSHEKSRQINDLEQEVSQTRANMCQLEELCSQLQYERDAQAKEYQSLLSCYEAQKVVVAQIKSNSEFIRDKAKRRITAMEKDLAHKDAELETKAHELSKLRELVNDAHNKIKTLSCDLQQVERERSDVRDQLCEANMQKEQLEKQILILSEENKRFQQRLCEANELRDQAGHNLSCTEQSIDPQQTVKSNHVIEEENIQPFQTTCQDLLAEQKLIKETCGNVNNKCTLTDEEELLEAKLNETESIAEGVCSNYLAQLQEMYQKPSVGVLVEPQQEEQRACRPAENTKPNEEQADDKQEKGLDGAAMRKVAQAARQLEGDQQDRLQLQLELEILKQQLAEKQDTIVKLQREKDDLSVSCKAVTQKVDHPKQTSKVKTENEGNYFTPLKPERKNIRKPGEEKSVTKKLRSTARKRKSPELESSVESENRKNRRLKVNNRENMQSIETPTVQGKKVSQLKQKGSVSLKGKKDGALKKIDDFIQSSPTLFGSKAKKIISMVNVKSPELLNPSENNKPKRSKRKLFKTHVSSPLDIPYHPIFGSSDDNKESDHLIIKRKLRTRTAKIQCKH